jgi:hypothetical protein
VSLDIVLISGDLLRHGGLVHDIRFAVTTERGYGEWFQYAKAAAVALLLLRARGKSPVVFVWAGLFAYLMVDDAFAVHESFGRFAAPVLGLPAIGSLRPEQMGELLFYAVIGLVFITALAVLLRGGDPEGRSLSVALALPFTLLVFFGVVMDMLHSLARDSSYRYATGVIEDGGEMVAMSVLVALVYRVTRTD